MAFRAFLSARPSSSPSESVEIQEGTNSMKRDFQFPWAFQRAQTESVGRPGFISHHVKCLVSAFEPSFVLWVPICQSPIQLSSSETAFGRTRAFIFNLFMSLLDKHLLPNCYTLSEELSAMFTNINKKCSRNSGMVHMPALERLRQVDLEFSAGLGLAT